MIGGIGNMLFSIYSQTENVQDPRGSLVNLWGQVITLRGQILVSRTGDDTLRVLCWCWCVTLTPPPSLSSSLPPISPCVRSKRPPFKTSPCAPAPRPQVLPHTRASCRYTQGRYECTDRVFSACHNDIRTRHNNNDHNNTRRQGQRETEKEDRERETEKERQRKKEKEKEKERKREERREDQDKRREERDERENEREEKR